MLRETNQFGSREPEHGSLMGFSVFSAHDS
jgi:hypothetical protein